MNLRGAADGAAPRQAGRMAAGRRSPTRLAKPWLRAWPARPATRLPGNLTPQVAGRCRPRPAPTRPPRRLPGARSQRRTRPLQLGLEALLRGWQ